MGLSLSSYAAALDFLFARTTGAWKFGLDTTRALLSALGDPHTRYPSFHVGGTNGKGSVVATLDALLRGRGLRVGRYTSPHLVDFRERIVVDGEPIPEGEVVRFVDRWAPEVQRLGATFFEVTTCLAFEWFARQHVDVAVVEVGLGGRLDATNVIVPLAAAVISIDIEHVEYLGSTREAIAREKAGIFKRGAAAVIGERDPTIRGELADLARAAGAEPVRTVAEESSVSDITLSAQGTTFTLSGPAWGGDRRLTTPLIGVQQAMNTAVALTMLQSVPSFAAAGESADRALGSVRLAGRFEWVDGWIFDVAHNPAAVAVLCRTLDQVAPPRPLVTLLGVLGDKDWRAIIRELAGRSDRLVLTAPPSAPAERAWSLEEAEGAAREMAVPLEVEPNFDRALASARTGAATTLVTGSFHTVGDAMARLQRSPLAG